MNFTQETSPSGIVVTLQGSFTFKDHHSFQAVLEALKGAGQRRVLDLSKVDFLDSAALGMLLIAEDEASAANCTLTLRNPSDQITRLFELSAMDTLFRIERVQRA